MEPKNPTLNAMRIIWENYNNQTWDSLYEYPYTDKDRAEIMSRLQLTVIKLQEIFPSGI